MNFTEAFAKCISHNRHFQIEFCFGSGILILTLAFKSFFFFQFDNAYFTLVWPFEFGNFLLDHACRITISTRITSVLLDISHDRCLHFQINRETSCYRHVSTSSQLDRMPINSEWNSYDARYINRNT